MESLNRVDYNQYILSPEWQEKRKSALIRADHCCQLCRSTKKLNVHHNTYVRLGKELDSDLVVLCEECHKFFHVKRDPRTKNKYADEAKNLPAKLNSLPQLPKRIPLPTNEQTIPVRKKDRNGNMIKIIVTEEYRDQLIGICDGITYRGLRLLGEDKKWVKGWKYRCLGKELTVDEGELIAERLLASKKRTGTHKEEQKNISNGTRNLSDLEMKEIKTEIISGYMTNRQIARHFGVKLKKINRIAKKLINSARNDTLS